MTTIRVDCSPEGIDKAIDMLDMWVKDYMNPAVDIATFETADAVASWIRDSIHVGEKQLQPSWDYHEPGRLADSTQSHRVGFGKAEIIVGATDNKGKHYASTEQERGGEGSDHDFIYQALGSNIDEGVIYEFGDKFKSILDGSYFTK